ncbi:uncharacterized protein [Amphiura filiformis]|uniref:uncharacterized protein n=1 Tax=Amphiura filiformis TaxID=82378 RepID=UPI003B21F9A1
MRVRTSARAALYSIIHTTQPQNPVMTQRPLQVALIDTPSTSLTESLQPHRGLSTSTTQRNIFKGELADSVFRSLCHELGSEWQSLATQLSVPYQSVSKLQADVPRDTTQQCFQMLREHWFNRQCTGLNDQQIKTRLMQALSHRTVGRNDLADRLDLIIDEARHVIENQQ